MSNYKIIYQFKEGWADIKPMEIENQIKRMEELIGYNDVVSVQVPQYMNAILIDSEGRAVHL